MSNKTSNYPSNQLNHLQEGVCSQIVTSLRELSQKGKPETLEELQNRIDMYFRFCAERDFRCGIESLALSLGVTRQGFWLWCQDDGGGHGTEWRDVCRQAKQFILCFLESLSLSGRLNPASSIFYLKNWGNYKDSISFDDVPQSSVKQALSIEDLKLLDLSGGNKDDD